MDAFATLQRGNERGRAQCEQSENEESEEDDESRKFLRKGKRKYKGTVPFTSLLASRSRLHKADLFWCENDQTDFC